MNKQETIIREIRTVRDVIERMAEIRTDAVFLISPETGEELTFKELRLRAITFSRRLLSLGLSKGDKVSFLLDNGLFSVELILGAMYGGFVPVPLNLAAGQSQLTYCLDHSDSSIVFVSEEYGELLHNTMGQVERQFTVIPTDPDRGPDWRGRDVCADALFTIHEEDEALLLYTSGSTGQPKGVLASHRNLLTGRLSIVSSHQLSLQDRSLCVLPLYHGNAIMILMSTLLSGGSLLMPRRFSVASFWDWVVEYHCTWFALVPTIISQLVNWTDPYAEGKGGGLVQVRFARSSSAPLSPSLHRAFEEKFKLLLIEAMGMTESWGITFSNPLPPAERKIGSPGIPYGLEVKIVNAEGHEVPTGQTGEIIVRGPSVMKGYYKDPKATTEAFTPDGWLRTGDLGYKDEDGYFFIAGRAKEIIIKGGENIAPREIDETLGRYPAVLEAAAVGVPDPYLGEDIVAYVVLKPGVRCQEQELLDFCTRALGDFKTPTKVYFVEDLPKGPSGKIQRLKLLERRQHDSTPANGVKGGDSQTREQHRPTREFVAPRTPQEKKLADIWTKVLQLDRVGIHDNFFDLGGHSLLAAGVISRVRDAFQVSLPLRTLFEAPTIAALVARIEAAQGTGEGLRPLPMQPLAHCNDAPLSFSQQRLWFLDQLEPESVVYNVAAARRLTGPLHVHALECSLNEIVRRHEILRTSFPIVNGQPVQFVAPARIFSLPVVDLSTLVEEGQETEVQRLATEEAQRLFDLAHGPLLRATLLRLRETEHVLLLTLHHIISDRWSMGIFFWELGMLYQAFSTDQPSPLPELPLQYADFAVWQRQWLQGEILAQHLSYWKQQLADVPHLLALPTDRPRPPVQTYRGARQFTILPSSLTQALTSLSRQEGVTLFMTLLAAFQTLLFRYSGQEDLIVGSPIANRNQTETENLIGFFVNMLVLRADLSGNPMFRELLQRVRKMALGAYAHQDLPFEKLVEELQPERDMSYTPLFQVVFHLRNVPQPAVNLPDLQMDALRYDSEMAQFDLTLALRETPEGLEEELEYNTDLFDAATIARLLGHYRTFLEGIVAHPDERIGVLPLLTPAERQQVLVEWNETQRKYPHNQCVHRLFAAQVERTPEAVAVVYEDQQCTYHELNRRANQLAHYLQKLGVGPDVLVGLCVERSVEMVVGLLGILKAGGAYVPLDPTYPKDRLVFMLEDAQISVLLTQQWLVERLPTHGAQAVCLDTEWEIIARESEANPVSKAMPENLAYVIYTSGSTGRPKGVLIPHSSIAPHCLDVQRHYVLDSTDCVLQFASLTFDASLEQILSTLISGARLALRDTEVWSPTEFPQKISDLGITVANLPPAYWRQVIQAWAHVVTPPSHNHLRLVIVGGEAMLPADLQLWQQTPLQAVRLLNAYGPTEATITATTYELPLRSSDALSLQRVPIGRPLGSRRIYILDRHGHPVPVGVPGELHIGGTGLARGYLNRPELTAEKFIPHPFSAEPGARLYKTGDLARYLPDGNIEFLGRLDHQVKLRGFRIELGEIEAVLGQHPAIRETVVTVREEGPGDKRLVAYVVPNQEQAPTISALRSFLKEKLPDYMVPSVFVVLESLPLTPNGKVDRRALPVPEQARPDLEEAFMAPRTPVEEMLVEIWSQVLCVKRVGIHDNFFDLGGHSLKATQVISRVRTTFQVELPLRTLFEKPTIEEFAEVINQSQAERAEQEDLAHMLTELEECYRMTTRNVSLLTKAHRTGGTEMCHPSMQERRIGPTNPFAAFQKEEIEQSLPARFEQQVTKYSERLAVKTKHSALTYDALNRAANRVAWAILAQRSSGAEPIALLLEQGVSLVAAVLGVLKAGKFYVTLDPSHPQARTHYILVDLQVGLIVTNNKNLSFARELVQNECQLLNIDELDSCLSTENPSLSLSPDTLIYIQYTSGSTGQPKGVVQNHRNVLHSVMTYTNGLHICSNDRLSPVRNMFIALLNGAAVYPFNVKEEGLAHLPTWLIQEKITIYMSIPSVFRHFVETLTGEEQFPELRLIYLEGEPVSKKDVELYKKYFSPSCLFVNRLAATETGSIRWYFIDKETQINGNLVPAGYAVEDKKVLLLDDAGEEVGFNDIGEIAVKSHYLSLGYWRKPDLTRAAFLPDPAGGSEQIYLTGDLGRMSPDGCLEYLGRKDFQVKVRGNRIEVAEIELALLNNFTTIKETIVVAREDRPGDHRLVAYIVPTKHLAPTVSELRSCLKEQLPDYMIPAAFVMLDALPLTPTGKVDRRALPPPGRARPEMEVTFVAPATPVEEVLAEVWVEVLGLDQVGIYDNFLDLGGNSLLATQTISRIRDAFQVEVPLQSLLKAPTIAQMAVVIAQHLLGKMKHDELAHMLAEVEGLSEEDASSRITNEAQ